MTDIDRTHFWHYILNEGGQPIQNVEIRLYLQDDPTTEANIYISENSTTSTTCSIADIKTDNNGFFEFWLAGESAIGGYAHIQEFILEWYKAGIAPGYIYNYNPWPNALIWRDTNQGADRNYKNKFVSDYLANKWWSHAYSIVPSGSPHDLHPVDFQSGCDNDRYNKVVSNKFLYDILQACYVGDSFDLSSIYDNVQEYYELVTSWTASGGRYYKNFSHPAVYDESSVKLVNVSNYNEVVPAKIIHLTVNSTRILVDDDIDVIVSIQGSSS